MQTLQEPTTGDRLAFIAAMLEDLGLMTPRPEARFLAYLIDMAREEAQMLAIKRKGRH